MRDGETTVLRARIPDSATGMTVDTHDFIGEFIIEPMGDVTVTLNGEDIDGGRHYITPDVTISVSVDIDVNEQITQLKSVDTKSIRRLSENNNLYDEDRDRLREIDSQIESMIEDLADIQEKINED